MHPANNKKDWARVRYLALATDYDGTLATHGHVDAATFAALARVRDSGRRVILVTGRRLEELLTVCPELDRFDYVVLENGGVLYDPRAREETDLARPPPEAFARRLRELGVDPLAEGRVVVATVVPHDLAMLQVIRELGLELQIVFNRSAVMALPPGANKASGMDHALRRLGLSSHEVLAVGDSANDHSFLERSECAVAVANAEPSIKEMAALTTRGEAGAGVVELIEELLENDLSRTHGQLPQHLIELGTRLDGKSVAVSPYGVNILIAGPSASGKSTTTTGIIEQLIAREYQVCVVDPEGDYGALDEVITLGNERHAVFASEVLAFLEDPKLNLNVNLLGIPLADRPEFLSQLFPSIQAMRTRTGRPHWLVLDEAHHMLPPERVHFDGMLPRDFHGVLFVTVHPAHLAPGVMSLVDVAIAVGPGPEETMGQVADCLGRQLTWPEGLSHEPRRAVAWLPRRDEPPFAMNLRRGRAERIRHQRKYAVGDMRDRSFYFRGAAEQHNLKAQNLVIFAQIAEGIDEETWLYHLRRGDYSRWFREQVKDRYLADQTRRIEQRSDLAPDESRTLIRNVIRARYTLPA